MRSCYISLDADNVVRSYSRNSVTRIWGAALISHFFSHWFISSIILIIIFIKFLPWTVCQFASSLLFIHKSQFVRWWALILMTPVGWTLSDSQFCSPVLAAEIVAHFFPHIVELHNYSAYNRVESKIANWKLLSRYGFGLSLMLARF